MSNYLDSVADALRTGRPYLFPTTVDELQALADEHPELARPLLPPRREWRRLGLAIDVRPFNVEWRERFLCTLGSDPQFSTMFGRLMGGTR